MDLGVVKESENGIHSSIYNSLNFLTPVSELDITTVTRSEADAYRNWRRGYQRNWSRVFDPIAIRFKLSKQQVGMDLTVMPLILGSEYRGFIDISKGGEIKPGAGDPHKDAVLHFIMSLNKESSRLNQWGSFLNMGSSRQSDRSPNPLAWLGKTISIYADEDPFWAELQATEDTDDFMEENFYKLPIAINIAVGNSMKLAFFLTTLRTFVEQSAPGLTMWQTFSYKEQPYVRIQPAVADGGGDESWQKLKIYYVATPDALVVTLNEDLLKRALDRQEKRKTEKQKDIKNITIPWLGKNIAVHADTKSFTFLQKLTSENIGNTMQLRSWGNIPILNELRQMFDKKDAVLLHTQYWKSRLVCPGGGKYVWNENWNTYESTVYGHPGVPITGQSTAPSLLRFTTGNFGLTFEEDGLRAIVKLRKQ